MNQSDSRWIDEAAGATVYDLGRELSPDVPNHPNHSPMMHRLQKAHGDVVIEHGVSAANDMIAMGTHVGTHIDGLAHIAVDGKLCGGIDVAEVQDRHAGFSGGLGMENVKPIVLKCVVVDVARAQGKDRLEQDHLISAGELEQTLGHQQAELTPGSAILFRTGWGSEWPNVPGNETEYPGPGEEAVRWALEQGACLFGSDTVVFEHMPCDGLPVHRLLLVERGIHILEMLDLEAICDDEAWSSLLVVSPLKLRGATGSPIRPVAVAP